MDDLKSTPDQLALKERRAYFLETLVFLMVLLPWMAFAPLGTSPERLDFTLIASAVIFHDIALTALVLYLVWRNGEGVPAIGWVRQGAAREVLLGVALFIPLFIGIGLLEALLRGAGIGEPVPPPPYLLPRNGADYALAMVLLVVVAVTEETVFRGYLLRRFGQLMGNRALAVALSSAIFALGHGYQGVFGVIAVGVVGVVFAVIYLKRGSLVAPMTMHFIQNFMGVIVAPQFLGS